MTIKASAKIHGNTSEHSSAALVGLLDTLQKRCKLDKVTKYVTARLLPNGYPVARGA